MRKIGHPNSNAQQKKIGKIGEKKEMIKASHANPLEMSEMIFAYSRRRKWPK